MTFFWGKLNSVVLHVNVSKKQGVYPLLHGLLIKRGVPTSQGTTTPLLIHVQTGSCVTVKRAHRRSTFSGFFGPPFLFSFTMNFSLQEQRHRRISPSASRHPHHGQSQKTPDCCVRACGRRRRRHSSAHLICLASRVSYREKKTSASSLMLL